MARTAEEILAAAAAKRAKAAAVLTDAQKDLAAALEAEAEADAALAAEETRARALVLAEKVEAAREKAGRAYLVEGVDLVALFPLGKAPPVEQLPGGGTIVVRDPPPEAVDAMNAEVEHKKKGLAKILIDVLIASTVDPGPDGAEGATLRAFAERYPEAAGQAAQRARQLGGAKTAADKRGRA